MIVDAKITVKQPDVTVRGVNGFGSTGGYPAGPAIGLNGDPRLRGINPTCRAYQLFTPV